MIKPLVAETDVLQGRFLLRRAGVRQRVLLWPQGAPRWEKVSDDDFMLDLSKKSNALQLSRPGIYCQKSQIYSMYVIYRQPLL